MTILAILTLAAQRPTGPPRLPNRPSHGPAARPAYRRRLRCTRNSTSALSNGIAVSSAT